MTDSSQFVQLAEMDGVPLLVGGSAVIIPGTTVYIRCDVVNAQRTYNATQLSILLRDIDVAELNDGRRRDSGPEVEIPPFQRMRNDKMVKVTRNCISIDQKCPTVSSRAQ